MLCCDLFSLQNTDEMLVHLQSFSSNSSFYTIPESAKNGVPLFYLPPNSTKPVSIILKSINYSCSQKPINDLHLGQAPVVQKVDNAIHRIIHYPLDIAIGFAITYPVDSDLSGG